jgi:hypothetical protein
MTESTEMVFKKRRFQQYASLSFAFFNHGKWGYLRTNILHNLNSGKSVTSVWIGMEVNQWVRFGIICLQEHSSRTTYFTITNQYK